MNFISLVYLIFIISFALIYYSRLGRKIQQYILLAGSLFFYCFSGLLNVVILLTVILITYVMGIALSIKDPPTIIDNDKRQNTRKIILTIGTSVLLLLLFLFKYGENFITSFSLYMPLGLSFFIFKSIGYCVDVYREEIEAEQNLLKYALFISYFPALIEGPISDYNHLAPQLFQQHEYSYDNCKFGLQRIAWGVFKKLVIANQIKTVIDPILANYNVLYGIYIAFGLVLYSVWLYADFSGFIDIAIGSSQLFGITLQENFNTPYFSKSVSEYWRRWHISLGLWFQKYLFYSLLRMQLFASVRRKLKELGYKNFAKNIPTITVLLITWLLVGVWHGSEISFPLYGLYFGIIMAFSFYFDSTLKKLDKCIQIPSIVKNMLKIIRTYLLVLIGYLLFWPANIHITKVMFQHLFVSTWISREFLSYLYQNIREIFIIIPACIVLFCVDVYHYKLNINSEKQMVGILRLKIAKFNIFFRYVLYIGIIVTILVFGAYGSGVSNQFAYFRF